jgi:hypothetical protein
MKTFAPGPKKCLDEFTAHVAECFGSQCRCAFDERLKKGDVFFLLARTRPEANLYLGDILVVCDLGLRSLVNYENSWEDLE